MTPEVTNGWGADTVVLESHEQREERTPPTAPRTRFRTAPGARRSAAIAGTLALALTAGASLATVSQEEAMPAVKVTWAGINRPVIERRPASRPAPHHASLKKTPKAKHERPRRDRSGGDVERPPSAIVPAPLSEVVSEPPPAEVPPPAPPSTPSPSPASPPTSPGVEFGM
jgi:hypothetical protein